MTNAAKIPASETIYAVIKELADQHADRIALVNDGGRGNRLSYGAVMAQVMSWGRLLASPLFASAVEIGLLSENRSDWAVAYLAIQAAGKTVVPIDANLKPNEIAYIIDHANIKVVLTSGRFEKQLSGITSDLKIISFAKDSVNSVERYLTELSADTVALPDQANECAVLIYTSGTTGNPKAVELTHGNIVANIEGAAEAIGVRQEDVFLSVLPLHHTFEATAGFLLPLYCGSCIVYGRSLKSKQIVEDIKSNQITILIAVPLLFEKMYHSIRRGISKAGPAKRVMFTILFGISVAGWKSGVKLGSGLFKSMRIKAGLNSIRMFVSGGAALPSEVARFFNCMGFGMIQGYGLTETSPILAAQQIHDIRFGSVGPPLNNVEIKIANPSTEGIGEILARGPNITRGYRGNAAETDKLLEDGWLHTGDLGRMKGGQLWITGRKKNVIVSSAGKNIYPEELEEKLMASLLITEGVIFGRNKAGRQGEEVRAIVVPDLEQFSLDYGLSITNPDLGLIREKIGELIAQVNSQVASFKRISGFEIQLDELEKTSTKKVKRFLYK